MTEAARVVINARDIHDVSHVTFRFPSIPDSVNARYRFTLPSPDATTGNAVIFWYAPADVYAAGAHYKGDKAADEDLIFKPSYPPGAPLYQGSIDSFAASGQAMRWTCDSPRSLLPRTGI